MTRVAFVLWLGFALAACGGGEQVTTDASIDSSVADSGVDAEVDAHDMQDAHVARPAYLTELPTTAEYQRIEGPGEEVKFSLAVDGREPLLPYECVFPDTLRFPYHLSFLRENFEGLEDLDLPTYARYVLNHDSRRLWGGHVKHYANVTHPLTNEPGIYGFIVYQGDGEAEHLSAAQIEEVNDRIAHCAPFLAERIVFLPDNHQREHVTAILDDLRARGVAVRFPEELVTVPYEPYVEGETYGYLRVVADGAALSEYGPRDVVAVSASPAEIGIVSGLVTEEPQSLHSHVNLRLREKHIPSAMLSTFRDDERFSLLADQLVHLVVSASGLTLESATLEDAEEFWARTRPVITLPPSDLGETAQRPLAELTYAKRDAYGVKAANLGELQAALDAPNRPVGFAIPFSAYVAFVEVNDFEDDVATLLANPAVRENAQVRADALDDLRDVMKAGVLPEGLLGDIETSVLATFGESGRETFLRFRSSTNVEDLESLSGAGLYDSASGCLADDLDADTTGPSHCLTPEFETHLRAELARREAEYAAHPERTWLAAHIDDLEKELSKEKTVADALRKVWRSLWNLRAFEEREYYGIAHEDALMGMAVHPRFVMESAEAVVVTNLDATSSAPLYRVIAQTSDLGVVEPVDPAATTEIFTFRRREPLTFTTLARSNRVPSGGLVLTASERETLAALLYRVQDHFRTNVYMRDDLSLDIEVEWLPDRTPVLKQARPYLGDE